MENKDTPMGIVDGTGQFYRGIAENPKGRPVWVRVGAALFSLLVLLIGIFLLTFVVSIVTSTESNASQLSTLIIPALLGILFSGIGIKGFVSNIKKPR